jgi:FkbM family methyltransferase
MNAESLEKWWFDQGDSTRCVNYDLNENSIVYDVGGWHGNWSSSIIAKYNPYVHIFEPIKAACTILKERFMENPKVQVHNFGLADRNAVASINLSFDSSSIYTSGDSTEPISLRDVAEVIVSPVDLLSINIEGGEYAMLERMLNSGAVKWCQNIQVQFHDFYTDCGKLRDEIRTRLSETHAESYCYPFVWESWRLKCLNPS